MGWHLLSLIWKSTKIAIFVNNFHSQNRCLQIWHSWRAESICGLPGVWWGITSSISHTYTIRYPRILSSVLSRNTWPYMLTHALKPDTMHNVVFDCKKPAWPSPQPATTWSHSRSQWQKCCPVHCCLYRRSTEITKWSQHPKPLLTNRSKRQKICDNELNFVLLL